MTRKASGAALGAALHRSIDTIAGGWHDVRPVMARLAAPLVERAGPARAAWRGTSRRAAARARDLVRSRG